MVQETVYDEKSGAPLSSKMRTKLGQKHVPEVLASFAPDEGIVFVDTVKVCLPLMGRNTATHIPMEIGLGLNTQAPRFTTRLMFAPA